MAFGGIELSAYPSSLPLLPIPMNLAVALLREAPDQTSFDWIQEESQANGPLEKRLFDLVARIQAIVEMPNLAAQANPAIQESAADSPWPLTQQTKFFTPLLRWAITEAIAEQQQAFDPNAGWSFAPLSDGPTFPSILNPRTGDWDPIGGSSIEMTVGLPVHLATGGGFRTINDPFLPPPQREIEVGPGFDLQIFAPKGFRYIFSLFELKDFDGEIRTCRYCFDPGTFNDAEGAVLFFSRTRTRIENVTPIDPADSDTPSPPNLMATPLVQERNPATWVVAWDRRDGDLGEVCLDVSYVGDPPHARHATWLVPNAKSIPALSPRAKGDPPGEFPLRATADDLDALATYAWSFQHELAHRSNLIEEPFETEKQFFLDLDGWSNPQGLPEADAVPFLRFGNYLSSRTWARALFRQDPGAGVDANNDSLPVALPEQRTWMETGFPVDIALGIETRLAAHFPAADGSIDLDRTLRAFERFAVGELTVFGPHGAPNGLNIFSFVELAWFLVQADHRPALWGQLLRVFGVSCELFVRTYHACGGKRSFCQYRPEFNPAGERAPAEQERKLIRQAWFDPLGLQSGSLAHAIERYERLLQASLLDDLPSNPDSTPLRLNDFGCHLVLRRVPIGARVGLNRAQLRLLALSKRTP